MAVVHEPVLLELSTTSNQQLNTKVLSSLGREQTLARRGREGEPQAGKSSLVHPQSSLQDGRNATRNFTSQRQYSIDFSRKVRSFPQAISSARISLLSFQTSFILLHLPLSPPKNCRPKYKVGNTVSRLKSGVCQRQLHRQCASEKTSEQ